MTEPEEIAVRPVDSRRDLRAFVRVPFALYHNDPNWVPPLQFERRQHFGTANPYFEHARARFFLACRNRRPVGRISAQIDWLAQPDLGTPIGHFGLVEAADQEVLHALLEAAEAWLLDEGAALSEGPYSLSSNDETGLLVVGHDRPPRVLMNYGPAWYAKALEKAGYIKAKDLLAYRANVNQSFPARAALVARSAAADPRVRERQLDMRDLNAEMRRVANVFNDAWSGNWGFVQMTEAEVRHMTRSLKPIIRPELVRISEYDGEPVAMIVAVPDLYIVLRELRGRLLPFGWAWLLWRIKFRPPEHGRVMLMGVRRRYQGGNLAAGLSALMMQRLHEAARGLNMAEFELSWILEDNEPMIRLLELLRAEEDKRYRLYRKALR
ncbi:hypothetical protein [Rhodovibrio salinarum]|uniref:N-acetyltransferase domain-containing protein n=1 Tax=Rhodovibrio salinarum TaxID=1087 RepID=A0A934V302_9PROT|nr:hypothetical protein [Rhodovibrio salinarum]MBK1699221.1 hypothetical protein [Rhodovibrio salinarum]